MRRSLSRFPPSILIVTAIALLSVRSASAGESARLVYSRSAEAAGCPDEKDLRQLVARRLGYDPFVAASMNTVVAELRGDGEGLRARVYVIRDGNTAGGTRELPSPSRNCTDLAATMALAISIAVDPDALEQVEAPPANQASGNEPAAEPPKERAPAKQAPHAFATPLQRPSAGTTTKRQTAAGANPRDSNVPPASESAAFGAAFAPFFASGPSPSPVFGASAAADLRWRNWGLALEPAATLASTQVAASGSKVRVWTVSGSALLGHYFGYAYAGALLELTVLNASGQGVDAPKSSRPLLPSAGIRFGLDWQLTEHWRFVPRIDALLALTRLTMRLDHTEAFKTPRAFARVGLGVEYRF